MDGKKLYRSRKSRMLCGVCGGIGEYLNIDPTLVRLLAVLLGCSGTDPGLHHSGHHYSGQSGIEHKIRIILTERDSLQKAVPFCMSSGFPGNTPEKAERRYSMGKKKRNRST